MRCPLCGNIDTQVKDSRPAEDQVSIRRRRFCQACGGRFTTYERVQLRDLVVIKSSGKREDFDRSKLERSIRIARLRQGHSLGMGPAAKLRPATPHHSAVHDHAAHRRIGPSATQAPRT